MTAVESAARTGDILGEIPIWCTRTRRLVWADLFKPALHSLDPRSGEVASRPLPERIGSYALRADGGVLLAGRSGLSIHDPETGRTHPIHDPEGDRPDNILNDGRCDRRGRFWVASMNKRLESASGRLYRVDSDLTCRRVADGIWIPNSLAWSPDDSVMYFADSHTRALWAYDFDLADGSIGDRRPLADGTEAPGVPDGSTVDTEGYLWNARFGGGCVVRYAPDGRVDRIVDLPVAQPTACAFGGDGLDILYVTTATFRLDDAALAGQPRSGDLLALDVGARGLPEPAFAG